MFKQSVIGWKLFVIALLLIFLDSSAFSYKPEDFPNYFEELINSPTSPVSGPQRGEASGHAYSPAHSPSKDTTLAENLIEQALFSLLRRIQLPHVDGENSDGSPKIVTDHFFEKVEKKIKERDRDAKVYISGGVVRSLLGYIYKKLYRAHHKTPPETSRETLERIISGRDKDGEVKEVLSLAALGIGSDLDILIEPSPQGKEHEEELKKTVTSFINSADSASGLHNVKSKLKYAVVPIGDVQNYEEQTREATAQGGSTLDWMAFPLTEASGQHMKLPPKHQDIFKKFIFGEYDYLPPSDPKLVRDPAKQTLRGVRPLLEIPCLRLSNKNGKNQVKIELEALIKAVKEGVPLSPRAIEQFEKMVRNARFEGAHNRFYSFQTDSPTPYPDDQEIEKMVFQLSQESRRDEKRLPHIPEFIMNKNPKLRSSQDKCQLQSSGLLMDQKEFHDTYTDHGVLFHGTPKLDNILSIIRNGFVVSSSVQGRAEYGRGAYSTKDRATAEKYGAPIEFRIKKDIHPRVIDWKNVADKAAMKKIAEEAAAKKMDLFQYLAENCDVDFVIHEHVLIQNSGAVELPKDISQVIRLYSSKIPDQAFIDSNPKLSKDEVWGIIDSIKYYEDFYNLGKSLRLKGLKENLNLTYVINKFIENPNLEVQHAVINLIGLDKMPDPDIHLILVKALYNDNLSSIASWALRQIKPTDPRVLLALVEGIKNSNSDIKHAMTRLLEDLNPSDPTVHQALIHALNDPNRDTRRTAASTLGWIKPTTPDILLALFKAFQDPDPGVIQGVASAFGNIQPTDSRIHLALSEALQNSNPSVRAAAASALRMVNVTEPSIYLALANALKDSSRAVQDEVTATLLRIKPSDPAILPILLEDLTHSDPGTRAAAAYVLGTIKPSDPNIHLALANAMNDSDSDVRRRAANALIAIKPSEPKVHLILKEILKSTDVLKQQDAASVLGESNSTDPSIHLALFNAFQSSNEGLKERAALALGRLKPTDPTIPLTLAKEFECSAHTQVLDQNILYALGEIKFPHPEIEHVLAKGLKCPFIYTSLAALRAVRKIKPTDPQIYLSVAGLLRALVTRTEARDILKIIRPKDPKIYQSLLSDLSDPDPLTRAAAADVLAELEKNQPLLHTPELKGLHNYISGECKVPLQEALSPTQYSEMTQALQALQILLK